MDLSESSAMMEYAHLASVKFSNSEVEQDRIASYGESGVKYAGLIIASLWAVWQEGRMDPNTYLAKL